MDVELLFLQWWILDTYTNKNKIYEKKTFFSWWKYSKDIRRPWKPESGHILQGARVGSFLLA